MTPLTSPLAVIHPDARLGKNVRVAPFALIENGVTIGDNCDIGPQVVLRAGTIIGSGCTLRTGVVIGDPPMDAAFKGEASGVRLGENNDLREYVTIHRATGRNRNTVIGEDNLIMPYTHIAHNCRIGNHVTITNACQLAGYVEIEDGAVLGGMTGLHQFVRVGAYAMAHVRICPRTCRHSCSGLATRSGLGASTGSGSCAPGSSPGRLTGCAKSIDSFIARTSISRPRWPESVAGSRIRRTPGSSSPSPSTANGEYN